MSVLSRLRARSVRAPVTTPPAPPPPPPLDLSPIRPLFDADYYAAQYPDAPREPDAALQDYLDSGGFQRRNPNAYFDSAFYLALYPDVAASGMNPLVHYAQTGEAEGRRPSLVFHRAWYGSHYAGAIKESGLGVLEHFLTVGREHGDVPHPCAIGLTIADSATVEGLSRIFDQSFYLAEYRDVAAAGIDPFEHFVHHGFPEGRRPNDFFDSAHYLKTNADVAESGIHPLEHYVLKGEREGRSPVVWFDAPWYARTYRDVTKSGLGALGHYLKVGRIEGRAPTQAAYDALRAVDPDVARGLIRLFDANYYLRVCGDVRSAGVDPLAHFLGDGVREGRPPNAFFDSNFYLRVYADVRESGAIALMHYLRNGWKEHRNPSRRFSAAWYSATYPDAAKFDGSPLEHFWLLGRDRDVSPVYPEEQYLPAPPRRSDEPTTTTTTTTTTEPARVSIVIPVYGGAAETRDCIESVLATEGHTDWVVVIVNDASPNRKIRRYLSTLENRPRVRVLHNKKNKGFVATANRGMKEHPDRDVLLLNSDTVVSGDWLDRIVRHARSAPRIATVTPFSNNATICSWPYIDRHNALPRGLTVHEIDAAFSAANRGRALDIPVAVGFCMFIARSTLQSVGFFDEHAFGRGYGEENDFCLRASSDGWRHLLAADVFVEHRGGVSFRAEAAERQNRALKVLRSRYPKYERTVQHHAGLDPALPWRAAATARLLRDDPRRMILIVTHDFGGGTERHIRELVARRAGSAVYLGLQPFGGDRVRLFGITDDLGPELHLRMPRDRSLLVKFLQSAGVERVHIHHVLGLPLDVHELVKDLGVPFDFTVHDYFTVCPKIRLIRKGRYCGEPDERGCNDCLRAEPVDSATDIVAWRRKHDWLLRSAERVICPSADVEERMKRRFPAARLTVVPHENDAESYPDVVALPLRHKEPLRVVVIGALSKEKGADLLIGTARAAARLRLPIQFTLVGFCDALAGAQRTARLVMTGPYDEANLPGLLDQARPHIAWFPALWPETFSYTLSAAFGAQLPVVVPNLGAFRERVSGRPWSWIIPWDMKAKELAVFFADVRGRHFVRARGPVAGETNQRLA